MELEEDTHLDSNAAKLLVQLSLLFGESCHLAGGIDPLRQCSPAALAYIGDAVYELYMRTHYLLPPKRLQAYHAQVVAQVRAESQALQLRSLQPYLTDVELDILRRGRNAASNRPKRVNLETYQQATSLETLLGYLYITDPQRLLQLLTQIQSSSAQDKTKE